MKKVIQILISPGNIFPSNLKQLQKKIYILKILLQSLKISRFSKKHYYIFWFESLAMHATYYIKYIITYETMLYMWCRPIAKGSLGNSEFQLMEGAREKWRVGGGRKREKEFIDVAGKRWRHMKFS